MDCRIYYTVDLNRSLEKGCIYSLSQYEPEVPEQKNFLYELYPDGLSQHGYNYLYNPSYVNHVNTRSESLMSGLIFELVRRAHFPNKPSRYQCLFATETLDEAKVFRKSQEYRNIPCNELAPIYTVSTNKEVHRGDMYLFDPYCSILELYRRAYLYWSGKTAQLRDGYEPLWEILISLPAVIERQVD